MNKFLKFDFKMHTKIIVGFVLLDIVVLALIWAGVSTITTVVTDPTINPERYLMSYRIFSAILLGVFLVVAGAISVLIPRKFYYMIIIFHVV